jgi:hypothetical protein
VRSLALLVVALISFTLFSGPLALAITSRWVKNLSGSKSFLIIRRIFLAVLNIFGLLLGLSLISTSAPWAIRFIATFSIVTHFFAFNREYGYFSRFINRKPKDIQGHPSE